MTRRELYSDHLDTLVALVQHLAMTRYKSRRPTGLSKALSLDLDEVRLVLDGFKGLFRRSRNVDEQTQEYYYTLQLRYARRWLGEAEDKSADEPGEAEPREPLEAEYLSSLLGFITNMVEQEQESKRQGKANLWTFGAAALAAVAATAAAVIGLAKP